MYNQNEKVEPINVAEEVSRSFLDYSMSVIISRALPDARDGLKPSQRRILYAMHDLSLFPNRQHRKCAKICGDTSGNYHPHGEAVIYPTLVHMAQPWAMRETLVNGQGNFGSVEGDPPAAMRYTEARMTHLGAALMTDMEKDTVDFVPNYDETRTEPTVFPAAFPNLLVNGGTGIAVGMATNIPPHNLVEVVDGICAQIDNPEITLDELMKYMKGPDFPTGCAICGVSGIKQYLETGRGSMKVRGKAGVEELKGGREQIVITEIPYNVNRATLVERIASLVNEKVLTEISAVRDESDENTRVVIELKRDANPKVVINNLYKHTAMESSFAVIMLAIDHGRPKLLSLKEANACYIEHRREVVLRRTRFELRKAEERAETLEGYLIALANLDEFIRIIRGSANRDEARVKLLAFEFTRRQVEHIGIQIRNEARLVEGRYAFSEHQANQILDLRLYQLTGLEREKIDSEYKELINAIKDLRDILAKEQRVLTIIKKELREIRDKHGTPRLTELAPDKAEINMEDLIANEGCIISITHGGFIKRTALSAFRAQRRGGKGVIGMSTREGATEEDEGDFVEHLFTATTHDYLMFFTQSGRAYVEKVYEIPEMGRAAKGRSIANILELRADEKIAATIRVQSKKSGTGPSAVDQTWDENLHIVFATRSGIVKKSNLSDYANVRKGGIIAIQIEEGDCLIDAKLTNGNNEVVLITKEGMSLRFHEEQLRDQGRNTVGVWGIRPDKKDHVVAIAIVDPAAMLLVAGENGIGKRTPFDDYRRQSRGGKGIITMKTGEKTGDVVGALTVTDKDELMLITTKGQLVRTRVKEIRVVGRNTMGVKLMDLRNGEKLQAIAPVVSQAEEEAQTAELSVEKS
ncbi:MAG: DNA gyrase subunit A [Verrucomicrobia bacterium]|nr:MAG: DNA gyrase subunit A [Verrucomicrobiota bacterium]PYJ16317.1 MAG: DNA gyrase subunit A [Verrucomicrobiota bacterium]